MLLLDVIIVLYRLTAYWTQRFTAPQRGICYDSVSVCVCLYVTSRSSTKTAKRIKLVLDTCTLRYKEIRASAKIRTLSSGNLFKTKSIFRKSRRQVDRIIYQQNSSAVGLLGRSHDG